MPPNRLSSFITFFILVGGLVGWLSWNIASGQLQQLDEQIFTIFTDSFSDQQNNNLSPTATPSFVNQLTSDVVATASVVTNASSAPSLRRPESTQAAQVKRAVDGDTIELTDGQVVRYIGIDTPETKHPNKAVQCFGVEASKQNEALVVGKTVVLESDVSNTDRYGRLLRYVWVDGQLINWQLVANGFAFAKSYPPDVAYQASFNEAQQLARENHQGLWSVCPQ